MSAGSVFAWDGDRALARQLAGVAHGDVVELVGAGPALVTALWGDGRVELAPLVPGAGTREVRALGPLAIAIPDEVSAVTTIDASAPPLAATGEPVFARAPRLGFAARYERFTWGLLAFDLQRAQGAGASFAIHGTDDAALAHVLAHQHACGRIVVACGALRLAVPHVRVAAGATAASRWLAPHLALALASGLRARGHHAVAVIDDVDGWRDPVARMPDRGDWSAQLAQLAARAYATETGSVTVILRARTRIDRELERAVDEGCALDFPAAVRGRWTPTTKLVRPAVRVRGAKRRLGGLCTAMLLDDGLGDLVAALARYHAALPLDALEQLAVAIGFAHARALWPAREPRPPRPPPLPPPTAADERLVDAFAARFLAILRGEHADRLAAMRAAREIARADVELLVQISARSTS